MHSKTKKRTRRKTTKKATVKSVADLPLCNLYIFSIFILEAALVVMVILSTPKKSNYTIAQTRISQTNDVCNIEDNRVPENLDEEIISDKDDQKHQEKTFLTAKSDVVTNSNLTNSIVNSNVTNTEESSLEDDMEKVDAAKEETLKVEEPDQKETKESDEDKDLKTVEIKEESSQDETSEIKIAKEENLVTANDPEVVETDDVVSEEKISNVDIIEESIVGAEEPVSEEPVVGTEDIIAEENDNETDVVRNADVDLLANIMFAEEGVFLQSDPENAEKAHKLCGSAVLHRMEVGFGGATSMQEVLYAEGQYAKATKRRIEKGQEVPDVVYKWAEELISNGPIGPRNMVYQAQFKQGAVYEKVGNQYFCLSSVYAEPQVEMQSAENGTILESGSVEPQEEDITGEENPLVYDDLYIEGYDI